MINHIQHEGKYFCLAESMKNEHQNNGNNHLCSIFLKHQNQCQWALRGRSGGFLMWERCCIWKGPFVSKYSTDDWKQVQINRAWSLFIIIYHLYHVKDVLIRHKHAAPPCFSLYGSHRKAAALPLTRQTSAKHTSESSHCRFFSCFRLISLISETLSDSWITLWSDSTKLLG